MKKNQLFSFAVLAIAILFSVTSCKPKDADIQKNVQTAIATHPEGSNVEVSVAQQVVTLTGEVSDESVSLSINGLATGVKDVKSVVNSLTIATPTINADDVALTTALTDALKDHPSVSFAVSEGVVTLTGSANKRDLPTIMKKVSSLSPVKINQELTIQ